MRFVFVSSNVTWGGSEDLWSEAAAKLARAGHRVIAYKNKFNPGEGAEPDLRRSGVRLIEIARFPFLPRALYYLLVALNYRVNFAFQAFRFYCSLLLRRRPDLVVLSQGGNHDGFVFAQVCLRLNLPFVMISQKATDLYWPVDSRREYIRAAVRGARHQFFVSQHNLRLTEEQLGMKLARASVIRNPFKVNWKVRPVWPGTDLGIRFACVGRLYPKEKGQDLLLRVFAREHWRSRPVSLSFFGHGEQQQGLAEMAAHLGLENVRFGGFANDIDALWAEHHALVLPSRAEGLPLVLVEAMLCGRVSIVTDVAGNREVLEDNVTGFLAGAPTEDSLDEAMERAWARRADWPEMGEAAAARIRSLVPRDPGAELAGQLVRLARGEMIEASAAPARSVTAPDRQSSLARR
jgi:glycosyltransferase involved in cell wall biosynthesis